MDKTKINAGFIVQLDEDDWREFEALIKEKVDRLIFVKRCPVTVKLEIKDNFPIREREQNGYNGKSTVS
jgi:hypothetical protein